MMSPGVRYRAAGIVVEQGGHPGDMGGFVMLRMIGILVATCGIVLLALGASESTQVSEMIDNLARRAPIDRATLLLGLGALATASGLGIAVARRRSPRDQRA
jgi:hypothetical protein